MAMTVTNIRMRQVLRRLSDAGAFSPETAKDVTALGLRPRLRHKQAFWYLKGRGALVEARPGAFYVDQEALDRLGKLQMKILLGVLMGFVILLALAGVGGW